MSDEFKLPDIGEGLAEGEIVKWLVAVGDTVDEDQPLVEVMTDKATVEIPSPRGGTVAETIQRNIALRQSPSGSYIQRQKPGR